MRGFTFCSCIPSHRGFMDAGERRRRRRRTQNFFTLTQRLFPRFVFLPLHCVPFSATTTSARCSHGSFVEAVVSSSMAVWMMTKKVHMTENCHSLLATHLTMMNKICALLLFIPAYKYTYMFFLLQTNTICFWPTAT
jgi:hypothetical protein